MKKIEKTIIVRKKDGTETRKDIIVSQPIRSAFSTSYKTNRLNR